jgi:hypothetical protein
MHLRSLAAAGFLTGCLAAGLAFPLRVAAAEPVGRLDLPSAEAAFAALSAEIGSDLSRAARSAIAALERASVLDRVRALEQRGRRLKNSSARAVSR